VIQLIVAKNDMFPFDPRTRQGPNGAFSSSTSDNESAASNVPSQKSTPPVEMEQPNVVHIGDRRYVCDPNLHRVTSDGGPDVAARVAYLNGIGNDGFPPGRAGNEKRKAFLAGLATHASLSNTLADRANLVSKILRDYIEHGSELEEHNARRAAQGLPLIPQIINDEDIPRLRLLVREGIFPSVPALGGALDGNWIPVHEVGGDGQSLESDGDEESVRTGAHV